MGDGERVELGDGAPAAASRRPDSAWQCPARRPGNRGRSSWRMASWAIALPIVRPGTASALPISAGSSPASAAKAVSRRSSPASIQHAGQEARLARGGANLGRADAGHGEEAPEPLAVPGNEGKRLNCQPSAAAWVNEGRRFHRSNLPFRNISALPLPIMPERARPGDGARCRARRIGDKGGGEQWRRPS